MTEVKIHTPRSQQLQTELDEQDLQTLESLQRQQTVEVYFDRDDDQDFKLENPDGSISWIARCVNINGIQWQIPAEVKTQVPYQVYEILKQAEDLRERYKPKPTNWEKYGLLPVGSNLNL